MTNSFLIGVLLLDMLDRRFPDEFRHFTTTIFFNYFYFYSKMQILCMKLKKRIFNSVIFNSVGINFENILLSQDKNVTSIQYIKNGEYLSPQDKSNSDFALFSWLNDNNSFINKQIIYDLNEPINKSECSEVKFMLIEIEIKDKIYKFDLKNNNYNFYLVGNKFTKQFFLYYLKQILHKDVNINDSDTFVINIIDQNIDKKVLDLTGKDGSIVLGKNDYEVFVFTPSQ